MPSSVLPSARGVVIPGHLSSSGPSPEAGGSRWSWLLPAGTFLAGCALGGVVMAVGDVGGSDEPGTPVGSTAASDDPGASVQADGVQGDGAAGDETGDAGDTGPYVRIPESCVQTAEGATTLIEHVDRVVAAVADLEPERLRQTVDDVQQVRDEVKDVADQCRAVAAQRLQEADAEGEDAAPATRAP